jgi:hypothetical protein
MKVLSILSLLILSSFTFANPRGELKDRVSRLARRVEVEVMDTDASNVELRRAQLKLKEVLNSLINGGNSDYTSCVDFALPIFERQYTSTTAIRKTKELCTTVSDSNVLRFFYEILSATYTDTTALKKAGEYTNQSMFGKKLILEFAYDKHSSMYTTSTALRKSVENARELEIGSISCLRRFYDTHSRSYSSSRAMDKTVETCSN